MPEVIAYLNLNYPSFPYTEKEFIKQADDLLSNCKGKSEELTLVELSILELEFLGECEFEKTIYRAHMQGLYDWSLTGFGIYVLRVFNGLSACGLPALPAFQRILAKVNTQNLYGSTPPRDRSLKVSLQEDRKKEALIEMAQLKFYLGDGVETAANKAAGRVRKLFGQVRGCSAENLERNFDKSYLNFVAIRDYHMSDYEREQIVEVLRSIPDHSL